MLGIIIIYVEPEYLYFYFYLINTAEGKSDILLEISRKNNTINKVTSCKSICQQSHVKSLLLHSKYFEAVSVSLSSTKLQMFSLYHMVVWPLQIVYMLVMSSSRKYNQTLFEVHAIYSIILRQISFCLPSFSFLAAL